MRFTNVNPGEHPELIIVGLGNYDKRFADSRISIGYDVIDYLDSVSALGSGCKRQLHSAFCDKCLLEGIYVFLAKPNVFMDNVGMSVSDIINHYRMSSEQLIVIYADTSVPIGEFTLSYGAEELVHCGLKSIRQHIRTADFIRIAVGVGEPPEGESEARYLNSSVPKEEYELIRKKYEIIKKAINFITKYGIRSTINGFEISQANRRQKR